MSVRAESSSISGTEKPTFVSDRPGKSALMATRRSAAWYGSGRSSTASTMLNIVVLTPMPSAIVSAATRLWTGDLRRPRRPPRRSWMNAAMARSSAALPMLRHPELLPRLALDTDFDQHSGLVTDLDAGHDARVGTRLGGRATRARGFRAPLTGGYGCCRPKPFVVRGSRPRERRSSQPNPPLNRIRP